MTENNGGKKRGKETGGSMLIRHMIERYDAICYIYMRPKAYISQLSQCPMEPKIKKTPK